MMKKVNSLLVVLIGLTLLTGCGFHLRGQGFDLNDTKVWLQSNNPYQPFERALTQRLETQGGKWVKDIEIADQQLAIENYFIEERVIARDSEGRPSELELIFNLDYRLAIKGQHFESGIAPLQTLTNRREFAFDRNLETGQEVEQQRLITDMHNDVISRLLLQMAKAE